MIMVAVIVRELPYLKLLTPIMFELHKHGVKYILYYMDSFKGEKEYSRPTVARLKESNEKIVTQATKVIKFTTNDELLKLMKKDSITKMISVEIALWARKSLDSYKAAGLKTYSISYLIDSLWTGHYKIIDKTYYTTKHALETKHSFLNIKIDDKKDKYLGSPIFDSILPNSEKQKDILILLPNIKEDRVNKCFGNKNNFINMITKIAKNNNVILKLRHKQWFPFELKKIAKEIFFDDKIMYPSTTSKLLSRTFATVMFFSSGIYECVYGSNYVINIRTKLIWSHDQEKMKKYFCLDEGNLYQYDGVVNTIEQSTILDPKWNFNPPHIDVEKRKSWMDKFIGPYASDSSAAIVDDILAS